MILTDPRSVSGKLLKKNLDLIFWNSVKDTELNSIQTEHNLDFEVAKWITPDFMCFRIGTCEGLWAGNDKYYDILAVTNKQPGNGHFNDVLQWFEHSCKRDKKAFRILELWNKDLKKHLLTKRGFSKLGKDNLIKYFD